MITDNDSGDIIDRPEDMLNTVNSYYKKIYTSETSSVILTEKLLNDVDKNISLEHKEECDPPFSLSEVACAINEFLNGNNSPGKDGLSAEFCIEFNKQLAPVLFRRYSIVFN